MSTSSSSLSTRIPLALSRIDSTIPHDCGGRVSGISSRVVFATVPELANVARPVAELYLLGFLVDNPSPDCYSCGLLHSTYFGDKPSKYHGSHFPRAWRMAPSFATPTNQAHPPSMAAKSKARSVHPCSVKDADI